ncbi:hypothetical protein [Paraburkholderia xenovorans]|uniref:hypothetical protein n=1 Tax=Paraburkholderia xenovorans TaxID=36873 RepID=UPI0038B97ECD
MRIAEELAATDVRLIDRIDSRVCIRSKLALDAAFYAPVRDPPPRRDPMIEIPARVVQIVARGRNVARVRRVRIDAVEFEHRDERAILVEHKLGRDKRHPRRNFLHRALREWHFQHGRS